MGFRFKVLQDVDVVAMGRALATGWDSRDRALRRKVKVTLWRWMRLDLPRVGSAVVGPTSAVQDGYALEQLPKPLRLLSGQVYAATKMCRKGMPDLWASGAPRSEQPPLPRGRLRARHPHPRPPCHHATMHRRWTAEPSHPSSQLV